MDKGHGSLHAGEAMTDDTRAPLALGTVVKPYGKVAAVGIIDGERYYWIVGQGVSAMMPASEIESTVSTEG